MTLAEASRRTYERLRALAASHIEYAAWTAEGGARARYLGDEGLSRTSDRILVD